jgi:hypothetical protein
LAILIKLRELDNQLIPTQLLRIYNIKKKKRYTSEEMPEEKFNKNKEDLE